MDEKVGRILFMLRDRINFKVIELLFKENIVAKSEIYKLIEEKREDVYYRINNFLNLEIIIGRAKSEKEVYINPNFKKIIKEVLETSKLYIEKELSSKEEEV
jgi:hypothetical protein